jgi:hypothetical protein
MWNLVSDLKVQTFVESENHWVLDHRPGDINKGIMPMIMGVIQHRQNALDIFGEFGDRELRIFERKKDAESGNW